MFACGLAGLAGLIAWVSWLAPLLVGAALDMVRRDEATDAPALRSIQPPLIVPAGVPELPPEPSAGTCTPLQIRTVAERSLVDGWLSEEPDGVARWCRIVPAIVRGKATGFKLYAIRPDSPGEQLGLQNGDTVHTLQGINLSSPDKALALYADLEGYVRRAERLYLELTRQGCPVSLVVELAG